MKYIISSIAVLFIFLISSCNNQENDMEMGQYTTIEYKDTYNMGKVIKGEIIHAEIEIKNTGRYPLVIADIRPACSCTVPEYDEDPIAPGKTTIINAYIDTEKLSRGKINKPINITSNTRPSTTTITIKATIN